MGEENAQEVSPKTSGYASNATDCELSGQSPTHSLLRQMTFLEGKAFLSVGNAKPKDSCRARTGTAQTVQRRAADEPTVAETSLTDQFTTTRPDPRFEPKTLNRQALASANRKNRLLGPHDPFWIGHLQSWLGIRVTGHLGEETMDILAAVVPSSGGVLTIKAIEYIQNEAQTEIAAPSSRARAETATQLLKNSQFVLPEELIRERAARPKASSGKEVVAIEKATGLSWGAWTQQFSTIDFLGFPVTGHPWLLQRLGAAQRYLLSRLAESDPTKARERLHVKDPRSDGTMAGSYNLRGVGGSFHTLGLAIDINKPENPWVATESGGARANAGNKTFKAVSARAVELMGFGEAVHSRMLQRAGEETTEEAWRLLQESNVALRRYRAFANDHEGLAQYLEALPSDNAARIRGLAYWTSQVATDHAELLAPARSNYNNPTENTGFMDHQRELVITLRDVGGLGWGAVDLGGESGDVMHFDTRSVEKGSAIVRHMLKLNLDGTPKQAAAPGTEAE